MWRHTWAELMVGSREGWVHYGGARTRKCGNWWSLTRVARDPFFIHPSLALACEQRSVERPSQLSKAARRKTRKTRGGWQTRERLHSGGVGWMPIRIHHPPVPFRLKEEKQS